MAVLIERFTGEAYQGGASTYHGLVSEQDLDFTPLVQADLDSIHYSIRNTDTGEFSKENVALVVADVITDAVDSHGHNFHVQFPDDSFPDGCVVYEVTFKFVSSDASSTVTYGKINISVEGVNFTDA